MKLKIMLVEFNGGRTLMLCDESGTPLPDQMSVIIRQEPNEAAIVTVEFIVGGDVLLGADD